MSRVLHYCKRCGAELLGEIPCSHCAKFDENQERTYELSKQEVRERAAVCLIDFEEQHAIRIQFHDIGGRFYAFARTDDDPGPVLIWNERMESGVWRMRELWLDEEVARHLCEFCSNPNGEDFLSNNDEKA